MLQQSRAGLSGAERGWSPPQPGTAGCSGTPQPGGALPVPTVPIPALFSPPFPVPLWAVAPTGMGTGMGTRTGTGMGTGPERGARGWGQG